MRRNIRRPLRPDAGGWQGRGRAAGACFAWLRSERSLTARITDRLPVGRAFSVRVLRQGFAPLLRDQAALFGQGARPRRVQTREVLLLAGQAPVVYAQTVLPQASRRHPWQAWYRLGSRALGTILFAEPTIVAGSIACRRLDRRHSLYHRAAAALDNPPPGLWARRALFSCGRETLLVTEVFLPAVLSLQ